MKGFEGKPVGGPEICKSRIQNIFLSLTCCICEWVQRFVIETPRGAEAWKPFACGIAGWLTNKSTKCHQWYARKRASIP